MPLRDFILKLVPGSFAQKIEAESKKWVVTCSQCGAQTSIWDLGGMQYKARARHNHVYIKCPTCSNKGWNKIEKVA